MTPNTHFAAGYRGLRQYNKQCPARPHLGTAKVGAALSPCSNDTIHRQPCSSSVLPAMSSVNKGFKPGFLELAPPRSSNSPFVTTKNSVDLDSLISNVVDLSGPKGWDAGVGCIEEDQEFGTGSSTA